MTNKQFVLVKWT